MVLDIPDTLARDLARNWKAVLVRGIVAILFGLVFLFAPLASLVLSIYVFAGFAIAIGVTALIAGIRSASPSRGQMILEGVLGIAAGLIALFWPGGTLVAAVFLIAAWAVITGVIQIIEAIKVREEIDNEWWLVLGGAASVVFGVLIALQPAVGIFTVGFLIGVYALIFGIAIVLLALKLKDYEGQPPRTVVPT